MERGNKEIQIGSCVDPLWELSSTDPVTSAARRGSKDSGGIVNRKNSTPLTPQEFELLSNSNPFKQDIAEKYGLAYPGITTRSHSRDVLNKARGALELGELGSSDVESWRAGHSGASGSEYDGRSVSKEESQSVFVALGQFLLRNRQSVDESIQKIDENDEFLSSLRQRTDACQLQSEFLEESGDVLESAENTESKQAENYPTDIKGPQGLNLREESKVETQGICVTSIRPLRSDTYNLDNEDKKLRQSPDGSSSADEESVHKTLSPGRHEGQRFDPYAAIRDEDMQRKSDTSKSTSDEEASPCSSEGSLKLSTHNFELTDLSGLVSGTSCGSIQQPSENSVDNLDTKLSSEHPGLSALALQIEVAQQVDVQTSVANKTADLTNFDDNFSDFISELDTFPDIHKQKSEQSSKDSQFSNNDDNPRSADDDHFATLYSNSNPSSSSSGSIELAKQISQNLSTDVVFKTVRVQESDGRDTDLKPRNITSPFCENVLENICDISTAPSSSPNIQTSASSQDRMNESSSHLTGDEPSNKMENDRFTSSFYTVFSTTVSSFEDMEEQAPSSEDKTSTSAADGDKGEDEKSSVAGEDDSVFGFDSNAEKDDSNLDKDDGAWDVFHTPDIEASDADINSFMECGQHSPCISKDILLQKKFQISDDSAESSRGSVSRESMKVNLSQDSSTLDQFEDFPLSMPGSQGQTEPIIHRHFDVVNLLDPLTECTSTDSIMVNVSNDSLDSFSEIRLEKSGKRPERSPRNPLSSEMRKSQLLKENRRRSLPSMKAINPDLDEPSTLTMSQSVDVDEDNTRRRSSFPEDVADIENITLCVDTAPNMDSDDGISLVCTAAEKHPSIDTAEKDTGTITPGTQDTTTEISVNMSTGAAIARTGKDAIREPRLESSTSQPAHASFATDDSLYTTDILPAAAKEGSAAKEINAATDQKGNDPVESPTEDFTEFIRSRLQTSIRAVAMFSSHVKDTQSAPILPEPHFEPDPQPSVAFGTEVRAEIHDAPKPQETFCEEHVSFREKLLLLRSSSIESADLPVRSGSSDRSTKITQNVNINIPPDLVPYEEVYTESLQSLPEINYENATLAVQPILSNAVSDEGSSKPSGETTEELAQSTSDIAQNVNNSDTAPLKVSNEELDSDQACAAETPKKIKEGTLSIESSSDSDGGDIDTIVQEYKQDGSDSDDYDIDHLVMEFKKDNPEQEVQSPAESDDSKQNNSAFNKFGRVLNKMQSVTKYMAKKKSEQSSKDGDEKPRLSIFALGVKQTKRSSRDEGSEDTIIQSKTEKNESDDAIDLLSKAAEVFKEQTVKKKKIVTTTNIWRSKTTPTENIDIEADNEYDLVARAAILFKGFKSKKPGDIDFSLSKSEAEKSTLEISEVGAIDPCTSQSDVVTTNDADSERDGQFQVMKMDDSANEGSQAGQHGDVVVEEHCSNDRIPEEAICSTLEPETLEIIKINDTMSRSEDHVDSDTSKMDDSGFESVTKHISEQLLRSDVTESLDTDLTEDISSVSFYADVSFVEPEQLEMCRGEDIASETIIIEEAERENEIVENIPTPESAAQTENKPRESTDVTTFFVVYGDEQNKVEHQVDIDPKVYTIDDLKVELKGSSGTELDQKLKQEFTDKAVGDDRTSEFTTVDSCTSDSEFEPTSPTAVGALNETTCDLILSTGYEDTKTTRKSESNLHENKINEDKEPCNDQRVRTNGLLDEISKEITALEATGFEQSVSKPAINTLEVLPPEYQRLSSDSSEGPDSHSLTVNFPESPDNMKNLDEDSSFSLCCGGNLKIHLNCTAMMKKPERRPSAVVIKDKRCVMTEEDKMFPLKISASYRDGLDANMDVATLRHEDTGRDKPQVKIIQDLKVNEHELNRNFAGSREELLEESSVRCAELQIKSQKRETAKETEENEVQERESGISVVVKEGENKSNNSENNKKVEKRKSMIDELVTDKETVNIYESVLNELIEKQSQEVSTSSAVADNADGKTTAKSKRFGRVMSDSDFEENFGQPIDKTPRDKYAEYANVQQVKASEESCPANVGPSIEDNFQERACNQFPTSSHARDQVNVYQDNIAVKASDQRAFGEMPLRKTPRVSQVASNMTMQQSIDVYDNIMFPEATVPLPERNIRHSTKGSYDERKVHTEPRHRNGTRSSFTSVVSDGAAEAYTHGRRHQGRTKWVSSSPHLPATERSEQIPSNRTSSYPYLPASELDIAAQYPSSKAVSDSSFQSDSVCWGNYARIDDVQDRRSYDSESSTSGLVIPGVGRESTLSDVSDGYIFGEYATVKDDINNAKVLRPLTGQSSQRNDSFQFRHFQAAMDESHYQNISAITAQPTSSRFRAVPSHLDVHEDTAPGFENYAIIGQPMQSKSVQFSAPCTPIGVIKVHCASQTSSESLAGLVRNDASDILEGLPVFEYTLGATQSTHSLQYDSADNSPMTRYPDNRQPDITRQTASLDRRKFKSSTAQYTKDSPRKKPTKVTFSRDEVLTEVIDGIKKSEDPNGRGLKNMATSTWSSLGGGVKEIAKIFHVPFQCCRSRRSSKAKPSEPPILRHSFRLYHFRRPHRCFVCKQLVYNQGSACQVCRYICHRKCELQVMSTCVPQVTNDLSNDTLNKNQSSNRSIGMSSQTASTMSSTMRDILNKSQEQAQTDGNLTLDVVYITERIISMTFPSEGHDTAYSYNLKEVVQMLKTKHGDNYLILNLSEKRQDLTKANPQVKEYGWPDHLAPPLERLCSLCKAIDSWLNADIRNVVILHCKGGRSRIASVIAAYIHYSNICASADQALDRFAMKLFYDDKLGGLPLPSQRRYVRYFSGLLSGAIKINSNPLYLHHILIHGVPNFDTKGGCRPFIKVYQGMQPIFTSGVYNVTDNMQKVCISISPGIPLRGDILIKCYHKKTRSGQREVMWQCQFHTCAISDNSLVFSKHELDDAVLDPRFPDNAKVEFVFGPSSDILVSVSGFKSDVTVPVDDNEESLARSDSYENFNRALDAIDGYTGHNASFNSSYTPSAVANNNINNNISSTTISPSYSSQTHLTNQSQQNVSRRPVQTLEERTQLDELLSDLLSDQAYVSPTQRSPRSFQTAVQSQHTPLSPSGTGSHITTSPTMSNAKTFNTSNRSYTTYSSSDAHRNPDKLLIQRAEVSYKVPGQGEVKDHYTIAADPTDLLDTTPSRPSQPYHPKGVPNNAFSYTAGMSSSQQTSTTQRAEVVEHEIIRTQPTRSLQSPPSSAPTYRPEYDPRFETGSSSSYNYSSLDENTNSWLQQQQQKLKNAKEGRDSSGRTEQEKKLVNELRYAQNKYYAHRDHSEEEETDSRTRQTLQNGPTSPERITSSYAVPQRSQSSAVVDGQWPQDQYYNTSYSTSSYSESRSYGDKRSNKPPPSPTMQRSQPVTSVPMPVPARTSSKEYMRTRSNSSSSSWQQQQQQQQQQQLPPQRPLQRQQSDTLYDRNRDVEHILPRSYGSTHSTPPHSPRAISPSGPHSTTTYTTYRTIERQRDAQEEMLRAKRALQQQQQQALPPQQPPTQINHHYITEVFVHRTDLNKDKTDSSTRLDELEKNLEAASQSIKSSQQQMVRQVPPQQVFEESLQSHSSRQYQTYQETKPEPPRVKEIEEDRIMLRPIGPGMQTLEPETAHTGTLGRPTTPGFPTGPATPPFPVSPRTPYQNTATFTRFGGSQQIISPTGTLQQPIQQQQHQTVQYQHYQTQHHQTHHDGQGQGTLHIDTSPKMFIAPQSPPSAGSPPSPGNFNTLRQQLSSAHSMSGSVISPGPHSLTGQSSPSVYFGLSRRGSLSSLTDSEMVHTTPKFVKDMSKYWYKPNISREEAIQMLKDKQPGTFVIRDSNSFPGAFGLALKVATIPPNVQAKPSGDPQADLVRHFLIEPTPKGVRLRGCSNEPVFGSLAALVYQHSITPLALPCKLMLPEADVDGVLTPESPMSATELNSAATLLAQGAACNVIYINSVDMESLTGPQAVAKAVKTTFENLAQGRTTMVHFKVSSQGITLTDNNRKLFFRRHYPVTAVTYCGMDPQDRRWKREIDAPGVQGDARIFGFVARKQGSSNENMCHIFAELDPEQPASAIVNFVTKVMIGQSKVKT